MVDRKRPPIVVWIIPVFVGLAGFYRVTQSPSFELYRAVDIVQFLGSGLCFGAAMTGVIFMLLRWRPYRVWLTMLPNSTSKDRSDI
jgi:hypothetical protein